MLLLFLYVVSAFDELLRQPSNMRRIFIITAVDVRSLSIVPHFIKHYNALGIPLPHFLFVLNSRVADEKHTQSVQRLKRMNVSVDEWIGPFSSKAALVRKLRSIRYAVKMDWLVYVDVDEFVRSSKSIAAVIDEIEKTNATHAYGLFVDRVAATGELRNITDEPISQQYPLHCNVTKAMLRAQIQKVWLVRGDLRAGSGNHGLLTFNDFVRLQTDFPVDALPPPNTIKIARRNWPIDHYKWTGDVVARLTERVKTYRQSKLHTWQESQRFLDEFGKHQRINVTRYCKI